MERTFTICESNDLHTDNITETKLRRRVETIVEKASGTSWVFTERFWQDVVLPALLHGELQEQDEWIDFGQSLDEALKQWSAGNGIGYLVNAFSKMPREGL